MAELRVLRLFGNPLEFLPEILPLQKLRHLSLANIRIVADDNLKSVNVQIEVLIFTFLVFSNIFETSFDSDNVCSSYWDHDDNRRRPRPTLVPLDTS